MFRLDKSTSTYVFYSHEVSFTQNGKPVITYTDDPVGWQENVANSSARSNFLAVPLVPSPEQERRLTEVNLYGQAARWIKELEDYVISGHINPGTRCPLLMEKLDQDQLLEGRLEAIRVRLRADLASHRYSVETGGLTLPNGIQIRTDREDQGMLGNAYNTLRLGLRQTVDWKAVNGWQSVTLETLEPVAQACTIHVQCCFTAERRIDEQLTATREMLILQAFDIRTAFNAKYAELMAVEMAALG